MCVRFDVFLLVSLRISISFEPQGPSRWTSQRAKAWSPELQQNGGTELFCMCKALKLVAELKHFP